MKLIKENLFEFTRGGDPFDTLGIGYTAQIHKFFDDLGINRDEYYIYDNNYIMFYNSLRIEYSTKLVELPNNLHIADGYIDLYKCVNLRKLPDNLRIPKSLNLYDCISLAKLPNNLQIGGHLDIRGCTSLKELPTNLYVKGCIYVSDFQEELIDWIESSRFKHKLQVIKT